MTLDNLFAVNGQDDEQEPWNAANDCECIDIRGEDMVLLCEDGVARWTNSRREWAEVEPYHLMRTLEEIYESGRGGNLEEAAQFASWMSGWWDTTEAEEWVNTQKAES